MSESSKLWSEIVEEADSEPEDDAAYVFSNGRRFKSGGVYEGAEESAQ